MRFPFFFNSGGAGFQAGVCILFSQSLGRRGDCQRRIRIRICLLGKRGERSRSAENSSLPLVVLVKSSLQATLLSAQGLPFAVSLPLFLFFSWKEKRKKREKHSDERKTPRSGRAARPNADLQNSSPSNVSRAPSLGIIPRKPNVSRGTLGMTLPFSKSAVSL
jgi:hypothetical protein